MPMLKQNLLMLCGVFCCVSCIAQGGAATETQAVAIAEEYVLNKYGDVDRSVLERRVRDYGKYWFVSYDPPDGWAGGGPKIVIEKSTGKITAAFMDQ